MKKEILNRKIKGRCTKFWNKIMIASVLITFIVSSVSALDTSVSNQDTYVSSSSTLSQSDAIDATITILGPQISVTDVQLRSSDYEEYYEIISTYDFNTKNGVITVEVKSKVNANTGKVTTLNKRIIKNTDESVVNEQESEIFIVQNNELVTISISDEAKKESMEKMLLTVEPLTEIDEFENPRLSSKERYIVHVKKASGDSKLRYKDTLIDTDDNAFKVVESNDLTAYLSSDNVVKICKAEEGYLEKFTVYAKEVLRIESEKKIRELKLEKTHLDVVELPQLTAYMTEDGWDVQPGQTSQYQQFVTPDDPAVVALANSISTPEEAYELAVEWMWVSDGVLNEKTEAWLKPQEFLSNTPSYSTNPVPGVIASDCSEQANTLVSILRALGVSDEDVRVVLGEVNFDGNIGGHAWVEMKADGKWLAIDATCGPYWDEEDNKLVDRNGVDMNYWKYHEYPVEEIWAYYNDVYYTAENEEVAAGWSNPYEVFTEADLYAGLISEASFGLVFIVLGIAAIAIVSLLSSIQMKKKESGKK